MPWLLSLVGLALFLWPFSGRGAPGLSASLAVTIGVAAALTAIESGARSLDSRRLALLAAIAAIDAGLRLALVTGIEGFSPVFFLILCAGWTFGPSFGFLAGSLSLLVSALITGGVGPWLPFQMFAAGWVGMAAGAVSRRRGLPPRRREVLALAALGAVAGFAFGALMDLWDWSTYYRGAPDIGWDATLPLATTLAHFGRFYVVTSLLYDTFRAVGNAAMVLVLGPPVMAALARFQARFSLEVEPA